MPDECRQDAIIKSVTILAEAFRQRVTDMTFKTYELGLGDLDTRDIKHAVVLAIQDCQFMPSVYELRQLCGASGGAINRKDRPLAAWQAVRAAISKVGGYLSPDFDDPAINAVVRALGGWPSVCDTPTDEMQWLERRFCSTYTALAGSKLPDEQTKRLPGLCEIDNSRNGYRSEPVQVAEVQCLTGSNAGDGPFITMRDDATAADTTTTRCLPAEELVARLAAADSAEPPNDEPADGQAVTPPRRNQSQQIAELKRIADQSPQQTDYESPEAA